MRPPHAATPVIYLTPTPRLVIGVSGQRYHVRPHRIAIDIKTEDARIWLAGGQARKPLDAELTMFDGHLASV